MARNSKGYKRTYKLLQGPWHGREIQLYSAGTLQFTVPSFDNRSGRYIDKNGCGNTLVWEFTN